MLRKVYQRFPIFLSVFTLFSFLLSDISNAQWQKKWDVSLPLRVDNAEIENSEVKVAGILKGDFKGDGIYSTVVYSGTYHGNNLVIQNGLTGFVELALSLSSYGLGYGRLRTDPLIADIDNDSRDEIVLSFGSRTVAYEYTGSTSAELSSIESYPESVHLYQNYPNPFNPETIIEYSVKEFDSVKIFVFNELGQRVRLLLDKSNVVPGNYSVVWDGKDDNLNLLSNGTYFYQIQTGNFVSTKKAVILK